MPLWNLRQLVGGVVPSDEDIDIRDLGDRLNTIKWKLLFLSILFDPWVMAIALAAAAIGTTIWLFIR